MFDFLNRKISTSLALIFIIVLACFFGFFIIKEFKKTMEVYQTMMQENT